MGKTSIYIKEEDEYLWNQLDNKSEWIHEQLTGEGFISTKDIDKVVQRKVEEELNKRERQYS